LDFCNGVRAAFYFRRSESKSRDHRCGEQRERS
jgi:hypothetical protein